MDTVLVLDTELDARAASSCSLACFNFLLLGLLLSSVGPGFVGGCLGDVLLVDSSGDLILVSFPDLPWLPLGSSLYLTNSNSVLVLGACHEN